MRAVVDEAGMAAISRPSAPSSGLRVIELNFFGLMLQLASREMGPRRRWVCSSLCWSPATAAHRRAIWTGAVDRYKDLVNRCGRDALIDRLPTPRPMQNGKVTS